MTDAIAEKILDVLNGQRFATWYNQGNFDSYISGTYEQGDPRQPTKEQILVEIKNHFRVVGAHIDAMLSKTHSSASDLAYQREYILSQFPEQHEMGG